MVQSYLFDLLDFLFPIRGAELWLSERPEARLSLSLSLSPTRPRSVSSWLSPPVSSSVSLSVCSRLLPSRFCSSLPLERRRAKLRAFLTVFIERFLQHSQVRSKRKKGPEIVSQFKSVLMKVYALWKSPDSFHINIRKLFLYYVCLTDNDQRRYVWF